MRRVPVIRMDLNNQVDAPDDGARYRWAAEWVAEQYNLQKITVSIAIVDDETIHELNREHLDHDWPTDVISFVFEFNEEHGVVEGEIVASRDTAVRLCSRAGWSAEDELLLYVVHGLLHLAGLDDIDPEDAAEMRGAERDCLLALGVSGLNNIWTAGTMSPDNFHEHSRTHIPPT